MENANQANQEEQKTINEPHVTIMGEEMGDKTEAQPRSCAGRRCRCGRYGRCRCGGGVFGLAFIAAGVILLLNYAGIVPWIVWKLIAQFWPAIFIMIGLKVLLGRGTVGRAIACLLNLAIIAFIVWAALASVKSPMALEFARWPWQAVDTINVK